MGELDSSFYRDDLRKHSNPIVPHKMSMNLSVDEKNVVFIDDVLFTGRSVRDSLYCNLLVDQKQLNF